MQHILELFGLKMRNPDVEILKCIERGLNFKHYKRIKKLYGFSDQQMIRALGLRSITLQASMSSNHFSSKISEQMFLMGELYLEGLRVFGKKKNFQFWLNEPAIDFDGEKPIKLLKGVYGFRLLTVTLRRIQHGIPM